MNTEEYIGKAESALLHTYNRYPVVLDRGEGVYLYDVKWKKIFGFSCRHCCICFWDITIKGWMKQ